MDNRELRLECVRLATCGNGFANLKHAMEIYDFTTGKSDTVTVTQDSDGITVNISLEKIGQTRT